MVVLVVFARRRERIARLLPFKQARWRGVLWLLSIARGLNPYLRSIAMESEELLKAAMWRGVWWVICSGGKLAGENLGFVRSGRSWEWELVEERSRIWRIVASGSEEVEEEEEGVGVVGGGGGALAIGRGLELG